MERAKLHRLMIALRWYQEKAVAMNRYMGDSTARPPVPPKEDAMLAVAVEMALDNGARARDALK